MQNTSKTFSRTGEGETDTNTKKEPHSVAPSSDDPPLDLLVIGAGPIGLSTALGAIQRGAKRVVVVEQARSLTKAGQTIDILPNAQHACRLLHPDILTKLQSLNRRPKGGPILGIINVDGEPIASPHNSSVQTINVKWWELQRTLISLLPSPDMLLLNHHLVDIVHEDEHSACATFVMNRHLRNNYRTWEEHDGVGKSDQEVTSVLQTAGLKQLPTDMDASAFPGTELLKIRARVVVGADGVNSVARRCIYRDVGNGWGKFSTPLYAGFLQMFARGESNIAMRDQLFLKESYVIENALCRVICREKDMGFDGLRWILCAIPITQKPGGVDGKLGEASDEEERVRWISAFIVPIDEELLKRSTKEELVDIAMELAQTKGFPEEMIRLNRSLWKETDTSRQWLRPMYILPVVEPIAFEAIKTMSSQNYPDGFFRPWYHKRVVLVGDALHATPPFLAQGAAMGMEDAYELTARLGKSGVWSGNCGEGVDEGVLENSFRGYREARMERLCYVQKQCMNRCSEYNYEEKSQEIEKLWRYEPSIQE